MKIYFYMIGDFFTGDEANIIIPLMQNNIENVMFAFKYPGEQVPPLYCLIQKFIANIAGINEYSMRFLSLLFGIINLFVFIQFSKEFLNKKLSIIFAIALFAINLIGLILGTMFSMGLGSLALLFIL